LPSSWDLSSGNSALALSLTKYSRNDFDQAFPNSVLEDWDSQKQGTRINNGQTLNGITYNTSSGAALVTTKFLPSTQPNGLGSISQGFFTVGEIITFSFAQPLIAFGIDINTFSALDGAYIAILPDGTIASSIDDPFFDFQDSTGQFLGFSSSAPFSSISITSNYFVSSESFTLDTLRGVPSQQIPSPMMLPGLLGLRFAAWKKHRNKS
jgi:hypothetical protein